MVGFFLFKTARAGQKKDNENQHQQTNRSCKQRWRTRANLLELNDWSTNEWTATIYCNSKADGQGDETFRTKPAKSQRNNRQAKQPGATIKALEEQMRNLQKGVAESTGLTLMEMLVAVSFVGILSAIALPNYLHQVNRTRQNEAASTIAQIQTNIAAYTDEFGVLPASWAELNDASAVMTESGPATADDFDAITLASGFSVWLMKLAELTSGTYLRGRQRKQWPWEQSRRLRSKQSQCELRPLQ